MLRITNSGPNSLFLSATAGLLLVASSAFTSACDAPVSREDLNPAGPPMVRQVMLAEQISPTKLSIGQLAFGTHSASFFENDDGEVLSAVPLASQEIRIVLDELVRGNALEEIQCTDLSYSRIPNGTTPDDISDCTGPVDAIKDKCTAVCLSPSDGTPIGVLDDNDDGSTDNMRMIDYNDDSNIVELAVAVECDGVTIPLDQDFSFWSPSGNQTFPSNDALSFRGLGPVVVVRPLDNIGLRTGAQCGVTFRPEVVDYDGNKVCAPTGGQIDGDCSDGDTSKISFGTDSLRIVNTLPIDGATSVGIASSSFLIVAANAYIDVDTVTSMILTENGTPISFEPIGDTGFIGDDRTLISFKLASDFLVDSTYVLTIGTDLKDALGGAMPAEQLVTWTTEGLALLSSSVSDGATGVGPGIIELDFNGVVLDSSFAAITMTRGGTPTGNGTPATDGVAVALTKTLKSGDGSIVKVDMGTEFAINTYYELVVTTAVEGREGGMIAEDQLFTFTTAGFELASSTPAEGDVDVAVSGGDITLRFNTEIDAATLSSISLTADTTAVSITPVVQADAREVRINVGTSFAAGASYQLTVASGATGLKEVGGTSLAADLVINWTTAN